MTQKSIKQVSAEGPSAVKLSSLLMVLAVLASTTESAFAQDSIRTKSNNFAGPGKGHFFGGKRANKKQENGFEAKCNGSCSGSCK